MKKQMSIMRPWAKGLFYTFAALCVGACGEQKAQQGAMVNEVAVMPVELGETTLNSSYPVTIEGIQDVEIRPKVSGFITNVLVSEGDFVKKGQLLFELDSIQYKAAVETAKAAVLVAEASIATAELNVETRTELFEKNIISEYELQTAKNTLASAKASLAQAQAQLLNALDNLSYTQVESPSDGVVGKIPYKVGSLVSASIATPLTTVSDIANILVNFSMTEKQLLEFTREGGTMQEIINSFPPVQLVLADGSLYKESGKVKTISGVIDPATHSVRMQALFPNTRNVLRSGGTGNLLLPVTRDSLITVPQLATFELQDKKFVYIVSDSSTLVSTEIQVLPENDGQNYFVTGGLKPGDRIAAEGVALLRNGAKIKPITKAQADARVKNIVNQSAAAAKK